jgi:hypothetical protein
METNAFGNNQCQGLWVPACAGTTGVASPIDLLL